MVADQNAVKVPFEKKDSLKHPRTGHSVCTIGDKFIVATGSRIEDENVAKSVEFYNIELGVWFEQPSMTRGRYYHSSCVFSGRWVYIFAGIDF
jgi:hypothetical protein